MKDEKKSIGRRIAGRFSRFGLYTGIFELCALLLTYTVLRHVDARVILIALAVCFTVCEIARALLMIHFHERISRKAFKPLSGIVETVQHITTNNLSERIDPCEGEEELRELINVLNQMLDRVESGYNSQKRFISDASHELRTPLAVIKAECEYALSDNASEEDMLEALSSIDEQTDKMTKLVAALLTLSRTEQGDKRYKLEDTDLSELVKKTCADFVPAKNITLTADIEDNIIIPAQAQLISLMLENLLSNAVKYGRDGGHIEVTLKNKDGVTLSVKDDGIGIKEEDLPKIWGRFYRAYESRSRESGFGLGLSLVSQIAALHGGKVSASSVYGEGSEFTVTF